LICDIGDTIEKELEPGFPCAVLSHLLDKPIIVGAVGLEIKTKIKERLSQHPVDAKVEGNE
jgi:hypothetical protein